MSIDDNVNSVKKILLVEDEASTVRLMNTLITEHMGYMVSNATTGEQAVEFYKSQDPDLVIMDMGLEGSMTGLVASRKILDYDPNARIVATSGNSYHDALVNYKDHGFMGKIEKPAGLSEIKNLIESTIR